MYKYSVPIMFRSVNDENRQRICDNLRDCGVERIFLAIDHYLFEKNGVYNSDEMKSSVAYFKNEGFEVGVWCSSFGHGAPLLHESGESQLVNYTKLQGIDNVNEGSVCPLDENVVNIFQERIKLLATLNPDIIMLDDDYRLNYRDYTMGCTCELHLEEYYKRIGEVIEKSDLEAKIFSGNKNKYRTEWLNLMGETLVNFAHKMREAVDVVNSDIRLGFCGCWDVWDFEGTDCIELSKVFAGKTAPYLRTIGAPYHHQKISTAVETTRTQAFWCKDSGIEVFSEGDVYPRPRYNVPSRQLELFDLALIASGETDGILKYMYDYVQPFGYETGYTERHIRNAEIRKELFKITQGKKAVGVRIADVMKKTESWHLPEKAPKGTASYLTSALESSKNAKCLLTDNAIPTTYDDADAPVFVFGENAWYIEENELNNGAILDIAAAEILAKRGFDTGFVSMEETTATGEKYIKENDTIITLGNVQLFDIECNCKAEIESVFVPDNTPASYRYENDKGQRFFVIASALMRTDCKKAGVGVNYISNYYRKRQLVSAIEYVSRRKTTVKTVSKSPNLYMIATENENKTSLSVSLINPFIDDAFDIEIELAKRYSEIHFINCEGTFDGDKVKINYIEPYGFVSFEVK